MNPYGTRKQQARRLMNTLRDGPCDFASKDGRISFEDVRRWLDTWVIPPVERLVPELKEPAHEKWRKDPEP